ncbi:tRNA-specific adenosine deaminase 1 [Leguminivora glycinivorella]|uniref:tRNA-specific adenosine deaminase 1 n=1 Tax=Leguminivora glycinivorella TaxID=1035111 RepID=UPI00200D6C41|nr:tRNA-specific adenosine deaminase 1 [Leguminivora glycinivorella]
MGGLDIKHVVDEVAESCLKLYNELPKTGKPVEVEWTVLSCIIQYDSRTEEFEVVSLGTGSKCIGASKMSPSGDILNDSHAEVIARRGFLTYLYENIEQALDSKQSIFKFENGLFELKHNINFIFYSSQLPCGDASILPKSGEEEQYGDILQSMKKQASEDICDVEHKRAKADIHRTGARCLPDSEQDFKQPGESYHILGQVRTKPGRGDRTQSVSCSDKMARWIHVGIQGGLLDLLLSKPIFVSSFIFGSKVPYSEESLARALLKRNAGDLSLVQPGIMPQFYQSTLVFPHIRTEKNLRPAPGSIIWMRSKGVEVAVQGRKLGVTKKKAKSLSSSLFISKYNIYKRFLNVLNRTDDVKKSLGLEKLQDVPYNEMKRKSKRYLDQWELVKDIFFKSWTKKPDMWNFCVEQF